MYKLMRTGSLVSNSGVGSPQDARPAHLQRPAGPQCRNDGAPYPCRLHRWGRRVLRLRGLSDHEVDDLVARSDPDAPVPGHEQSGQ